MSISAGKEKWPLFAGQRFTKLTVIGRSHVHTVHDGHRQSRFFYNCLCHCGKIIIVRKDNLRGGRRKSCGCWPPDTGLRRKSFFRFVAGSQFGRWTVIRYIKGKCSYLCRCSCGTMRVVSGQHLKNGRSQSCGCLRRENTTLATLPIGFRQGRLTVFSDKIERVGPKNVPFQEFKCDCGVVKMINLVSVRSGGQMSCGCLLRENDSLLSRRRPLPIGFRQGRLTVFSDKIERVGPKNVPFQEFKCDCGVVKMINLGCVRNKGQMSCGCLKRTRPGAKEYYYNLYGVHTVAELAHARKLIRDQMGRTFLGDNYIKRALHKGLPLSPSAVPAILIKLKRNQMVVKRNLLRKGKT